MQSIGSNDHVDKIWSLAKYVRVAMMTTWHSGEIAARPMYSIINDDEKVVWFIAERHSAKVHVAQRESEALLTFSNGTGGDHLVMNGDLTLIDDREKLKSLWNPGTDIFFPKGPADEDAALLCFTPTSAEYWAGGAMSPSFAISFLEAKWVGKRRHRGEHAAARH